MAYDGYGFERKMHEDGITPPEREEMERKATRKWVNYFVLTALVFYVIKVMS